MASQVEGKYWTYEDLFDLPDNGKRYEIIEGVLYEMPAANTDHGTLVMNLILHVFGPFVGKAIGRLFTAPTDLFLRGANPVQPDLLVLLQDQLGLISKRGIEGPPALVVEVLSPSNFRHDRIRKRALYARAGVREYWIVSSEAGSVEILTLARSQYQTHARVAGDEALVSTVLPELSCPAALVFAGLGS